MTTREDQRDNIEAEQPKLALDSTGPPYSNATTFKELASATQLDLRAVQRTFEGAYIRTALGQLSFAMVILKVFSKDFILVGTTYTLYGIVILLIATRSRNELNKLILWEPSTSDLVHHRYPHYGSGLISEGSSSTDLADSEGINVPVKDSNINGKQTTASTGVTTRTGNIITTRSTINNRLAVTETTGLLAESNSDSDSDDDEMQKYYVTGGTTVLLLGVFSMVSYIVLFYLLCRMS